MQTQNIRRIAVAIPTVIIALVVAYFSKDIPDIALSALGGSMLSAATATAMYMAFGAVIRMQAKQKMSSAGDIKQLESELAQVAQLELELSNRKTANIRQWIDAVREEATLLKAGNLSAATVISAKVSAINAQFADLQQQSVSLGHTKLQLEYMLEVLTEAPASSETEVIAVTA